MQVWSYRTLEGCSRPRSHDRPIKRVRLMRPVFFMSGGSAVYFEEFGSTMPCRYSSLDISTFQVFSTPSVGFCKAHRAPAHCCYMYSVSDDRYLKVNLFVRLYTLTRFLHTLAASESFNTTGLELITYSPPPSVSKVDRHRMDALAHARNDVRTQEAVFIHPQSAIRNAFHTLLNTPVCLRVLDFRFGTWRPRSACTQ